jgi:hypothetical protein
MGYLFEQYQVFEDNWAARANRTVSEFWLSPTGRPPSPRFLQHRFEPARRRNEKRLQQLLHPASSGLPQATNALSSGARSRKITFLAGIFSSGSLIAATPTTPATCSWALLLYLTPNQSAFHSAFFSPLAQGEIVRGPEQRSTYSHLAFVAWCVNNHDTGRYQAEA